MPSRRLVLLSAGALGLVLAQAPLHAAPAEPAGQAVRYMGYTGVMWDTDRGITRGACRHAAGGPAAGFEGDPQPGHARPGRLDF